MARYTQPHYEHHRREILQTRRRFQGALSFVFVALFIFLGLQFRGSEAATMYTASGRVYNATTGVGYANVRIDLCHGNSAITNGSGYWSHAFTWYDFYCVYYVSGVPGGVNGPVLPHQRPEHAGASTYESQASGIDCYHDTSCGEDLRSWDWSADTGFDFYYTNPPTPTPKPPTPAPVSPTPVPVAPTPKPATPKPATPRPATPKPATPRPLPVAPALVASAPSPDTTPPSAPNGFSAMVAGDNAVISLSWEAAADNVGIKGYRLERSIDQKIWTAVGGLITLTRYRDDFATFNTLYYYRLRAEDTAGNQSETAGATALTPNFQANNSPSSTTYTSDDKVATALLPGGILDSEANCSIATDPTKVKVTDRILVAGPYRLVCKNIQGEVLRDFKKPVTWTLSLRDKMKGRQKPEGVTVDAIANKALVVKKSTYNTKTQLVQFNATGIDLAAVVAQPGSAVSIGFIFTIVLVLALVGVMAYFLLRRTQVQNYDSYLRSKYYNF